MTATARATTASSSFPAVHRAALETVQVNLGYRCNQACHHCHVDAGPLRTESMDAATIDLVLEFAHRAGARELDLTGGAPELNPHFRDLVQRARAAGLAVIDRCNLTILGEPGQADLADFLAAAGVRVVASLPCYSAANTDLQRGKGVFERSLAGIRQLNAVGYGRAGSALELDFVYNPAGPFLPPEPATLEADYRRELAAHGVSFNHLLTITNMPIKRFRHALERDGRLVEYQRLLVENFAAANLEHVMCRRLVSIDWAGYVYDCDFNQMLGLGLGGRRRHVRELLDHDLTGAAIAVDEHCYGCTAGRGSSCGGALSG
ncbi:MAG: arsenosugar biosynthesis radical SAM (seleno)protein ArsS [Gammaproteobacteria bacterium]